MENLKTTTWREALGKYKKALELKAPSLEQYMVQFYNVSYKKKETLSRLQDFEKTCGCVIPDDLKNLLIEDGALKFKDEEMWESFEIYSNLDNASSMPNIGGLVEMIERLWGDRSEFHQFFSEEQIKYLNTHYFIFGHYFQDDNTYSHFYFDREGKFGTIPYDQDDFESAFQNYFRPLLEKSLASMTLDELLSQQIDRATKGLENDE